MPNFTYYDSPRTLIKEATGHDAPACRKKQCVFGKGDPAIIGYLDEMKPCACFDSIRDVPHLVNLIMDLVMTIKRMEYRLQSALRD